VPVDSFSMWPSLLELCFELLLLMRVNRNGRAHIIIYYPQA
jgi:hypothetical protein